MQQCCLLLLLPRSQSPAWPLQLHSLLDMDGVQALTSATSP